MAHPDSPQRIAARHHFALRTRQTTPPTARIPQLFEQLESSNDGLRQAFDEFRVEARAKYPPEQARQLEIALQLAAVGHQYNDHHEKRYRKKRTDTGERQPVILHPLAIAKRLMQDDFDWITVATGLLHDVPEDVKLGDIEGSEAWFQAIRKTFADSGVGELLISTIQGVTEEELPPVESSVGNAIRHHLSHTQIYRMIEGYVSQGGVKGSSSETLHELTHDERENILGVVYNLELLFTHALSSPQQWRSFAVKITDIWHNFQSPEYVRESKILRGRIAAGLADWMGWESMSSDLMTLMAQVTDTTTPYLPHNHKKTHPPTKEDLSALSDTDSDALVVAQGLLPEGTVCHISSRWPVPHTDVLSPHKGLSNLPQPAIHIKTEPSFPLPDFVTPLQEGRRTYDFIGPGGKDSHTITISPLDTTSGALSRAIGRDRFDYRAVVDNHQPYRLRVESSEKPRIIDFLSRLPPSVRPEDIPETAMLGNRLMQRPETQTEWFYHVDALISFFYEPNMAVEFGRGVFPVVIGNELYFVNGGLTINEVRDLFDLQPVEKTWCRNLNGFMYTDIPGNTPIKDARGFSSKTFRGRLMIM